MIHVLLVEDEAVAARRLEKLLLPLGLNVIGVCQSNADLLAWLAQNKEPDLYFLDIHLSDGIVFDALASINLEAPIIFTTAYDQYAIKAFKENSIDYLLKPIDKEELAQAINKYKRQNKPSSNLDLQQLSQLLRQDQAQYKERMSVKIGDHLRSIKLSEVTHFYSAQKITFLHSSDGRSYPIDSSLDTLQPRLDPKQFFRVSRSHLVQIDFIRDVISYSSSRLKVVMEGAKNQEIVVSRDRVKAFKAWLG